MRAGKDNYYGFMILKSDGAIHAKDSKKLILQLTCNLLMFVSLFCLLLVTENMTYVINATPSCDRDQFLGLMDNDFPLFLTSCKQPLDTQNHWQLHKFVCCL